MSALFRCWIKKSELYRIYEGRIAKAKDLMNYAEMGRMAGKLDMALQYYYWAYSLIRSVQHPNEVKDESGKTLMTVIPLLAGPVGIVIAAIYLFSAFGIGAAVPVDEISPDSGLIDALIAKGL